MKTFEYVAIENHFIANLQSANNAQDCVTARTKFFNELIKTGKPLTDRQAYEVAQVAYYWVNHFKGIIEERKKRENERT